MNNTRRTAGILLLILSLLIVIGVVGTLVLTQHPFGIGFPGVPGVTPQPTLGPGSTITIDFAGRQNHDHPISSSILGIGGLGFTDSMSAPLRQAGFKVVRIGRTVENIFPTMASLTDPNQQDWSKFDPLVTTLASQGFQPLITLSYTPPWLQPQNQNPRLPNSCLTNGDNSPPSHILPTFMVNGVNQGPQMWGEVAAQFVAHMDHKFPNVKPLYEIWNEPNGFKYLCVDNKNPNAKQIRFDQYKQIYAAAGPLMRQQAARDGVSIKIGGPALANVKAFATEWIPGLVNDTAIAPYLDFISYHDYIAGQGKGSNVSVSGLNAVQDVNTGAASEYEYISSVVRSGKQPNAQSTPIYIDEYNAGNDRVGADVGSFRNSEQYGGLWNALFVADLLNTVVAPKTKYGPAQNLPEDLTYFTASNPPPGEFCLFGEYNSAMDCSYGADAKPYPAYYAYQLLGGTNYLDITNQGYVVSALTGNGLVVTGFFTKTKDNILIVNPTDRSFNQAVVAKNAGSIKSAASIYTLNQAHVQIGTQQVTLATTSDGVGANVSIPAFSVVALSLSMQ